MSRYRQPDPCDFDTQEEYEEAEALYEDYMDEVFERYRERD
jgi:hypothetical protein